MNVYQMKASANGNYYLAAEFKNNIVAYNSKTNEKIGAYKTHFEYGGQRMSISNSGAYLVAAAYGRYGVSMYDSKTGECVWTNKEIKRIQNVDFSYDDETVYVINGDEKVYELSASTGEIVSKNKVASELSISAYGVAFLDSDDGTVKIAEEDVTIKTAVKAIRLSMSEDLVFVCVLGGGLKCFDKQGNLKWEAENKVNETYVKLSYDGKRNILFALGFKYNEPRTAPFHFVDAYEASTGKMLYSEGLDDAIDYAFVDGSQKLISGDGNVYLLGEDKVELLEAKIIFD